MSYRALLAAALAGALMFSACGSESEDTPTTTASDQASEEAAPANALDITLNEFVFQVKGEAVAGDVTLNFTNKGVQLHHAIIGKLDKGMNLKDVQKFLAKGGLEGPQPWFDDKPLDMTLISPGRTAGLILDAEEGTYAMLCFMPDAEGVPHLDHGMVQTFEIGPGEAPAVEPDVSIGFTEDGPDAPELSAGTSVVEVTNNADKPGEVFFVKLAQGAKLSDVEKWFNKGQKGKAPAEFFGGTHSYKPGETAKLSITLEPGTYQIIATFEGKKGPEDLPVEFTVEG